MKRAARVASTKRFLRVVLAFVFASSITLGNVSFAGAGTLPPSAPTNGALSDSGNSRDASPTVVREIEASRTADSSTFAMSDGSFESKLFTDAVHYQDETGAWKDIDVSLVPTVVPGVAHTAASAYDETFASEDVTANPVSVSHDDWTMSMKLIGGEQSDPLALGDTANFPLAMTGTQLTYEASGHGLKDTLVLSSSKAPDSFTFFVSLKNLSLYASPAGGGYTFVDSRGKVAGRIDPLQVYDAATDDAGNPTSVCESATMSVASAPGGAYVTYKIPRDWLDAPERSYPVRVDPSYGFGDVWCDTSMVQGDSGNPAYRSNDRMYVGYVGTQKTCRGLLRFNIDRITPGATINSASLQLYCTDNSSPSHTVHVDAVQPRTNSIHNPSAGNAWDYTSTWGTTFGAANDALAYDDPGGDYRSVAGHSMLVTWDSLGPAVQSWYNGSRPNNGFVIKDYPDDSSDSYRKFASSEYTSVSCRPALTVDWTTPSISVTTDKPAYAQGDVVSLTVHSHVAGAANSPSVEASVTGYDASGTPLPRGRFLWSAADPRISGEQTASAVGGGVFVYDPTASGPAVEPVFDQCSSSVNGTSRDTRFVYRLVDDMYGDIATNMVSARDSLWMPSPSANLTSFSAAGGGSGITVQSTGDHKPVPSEGPVLVFVAGLANDQPEYRGVNWEKGDHSTIADHVASSKDMSGDSGVFTDLIGELAQYYTIVEAPAQSDRKQGDPSVTIYPTDNIENNGARLGMYLLKNTRLKHKHIVFVTYSMGGLIVRDMLDQYLHGNKRVKGSAALRQRVDGVIQIGTPNQGTLFASVAHDYGDDAMVKRLFGDVAGSDAVQEMRPFKIARRNKDHWVNPPVRMNSKKSHVIEYHRFAGDAYMGGVALGDDGVVGMESVWGPVTEHKSHGTITSKRILGNADKDMSILDHGIHTDDPDNIFGGLFSSPTLIVPKGQSKQPANGGGNLKDFEVFVITSIDTLSHKETKLESSPGLTALSAPTEGGVTMLSNSVATAIAPPASATDGSHEATDAIVNASSTTTIAVTARPSFGLTILPRNAAISAVDANGVNVPLVSDVSTSQVTIDGALLTTQTLNVVAPASTAGTCTISVTNTTPSPGFAVVDDPSGPVLTIDATDTAPVNTSVLVTTSVVGVDGNRVKGCSMRASTPTTEMVLADKGANGDAVANDGVYSACVPVGTAAGSTNCDIQASWQLPDGTIAAREDSFQLNAFDPCLHIVGAPQVHSLAASGSLSPGYAIDVPVANSSLTPMATTVSSELLDSDGNSLGVPSTDATIAAGETASVEITVTPDQVCSALAATASIAIGETEVSAQVNGGLTDVVDSRPSDGTTFTAAPSQLDYRDCVATIVSGNPTNSPIVEVQGEATTNDSPITGIQCSWDGGSNWYDATANDGAFNSKDETFTAKFGVPEGQFEVLIRPVSAGKVWDEDNWGECQTIVDLTAPQVSSDVVPTYLGSAQIQLSAQEGLTTCTPSGVASLEWSLDGGAVQSILSTASGTATATVVVDSVGQHTLSYRATDQASNSSSWTTQTFQVNRTVSNRQTRSTPLLTGSRRNMNLEPQAETGAACSYAWLGDLAAIADTDLGRQRERLRAS